MEGLNTLQALRRGRTDAPIGKNFSETLGKSLQHSQVVPAVQASMAGMTSNLPHVRPGMRNKLLSGTGGLARDVVSTHSRQNKGKVMATSFKDARMLHRNNVNHNIIRPAHGVKSGGH